MHKKMVEMYVNSIYCNDKQKFGCNNFLDFDWSGSSNNWVKSMSSLNHSLYMKNCKTSECTTSPLIFLEEIPTQSDIIIDQNCKSSLVTARQETVDNHRENNFKKYDSVTHSEFQFLPLLNSDSSSSVKLLKDGTHCNVDNGCIYNEGIDVYDKNKNKESMEFSIHSISTESSSGESSRRRYKGNYDVKGSSNVIYLHPKTSMRKKPDNVADDTSFETDCRGYRREFWRHAVKKRRRKLNNSINENTVPVSEEKKRLLLQHDEEDKIRRRNVCMHMRNRLLTKYTNILRKIENAKNDIRKYENIGGEFLRKALYEAVTNSSKLKNLQNDLAWTEYIGKPIEDPTKQLESFLYGYGNDEKINIGRDKDSDEETDVFYTEPLRNKKQKKNANYISCLKHYMSPLNSNVSLVNQSFQKLFLSVFGLIIYTCVCMLVFLCIHRQLII